MVCFDCGDGGGIGVVVYLIGEIVLYDLIEVGYWYFFVVM